MRESDLPPVHELIPHSGDSILLDRVTRHDALGTTAIVVVGNQRWLTRPDGSAAPWLAVEYMAQCIGAHEGLLALAQGREIEVGFLVRVAGLRVRVPQFDATDVLEVRTRRTRGRPGLRALSHSCSIHHWKSEATPPLAEGRLMLVIPRPDADGSA
jgi:predicted hotdog family 3-hydroxylacyl-ACP dehydratase